MDDVWFAADLTREEIDLCVNALALQPSQRTLFIAVASGGEEGPKLVLASRALFSLFSVADAEALSGRLLAGHDPGARRLATLQGTLPLEGAPRLERLRFFLGPGSEIITFLCRRVRANKGSLFIAAALGVRAGLLPEPVSDAPVSLPLIGEPAPAAPANLTEAPAADVTAEAQDQPLPSGPLDVPTIHAALRQRWPSRRTLRFLWQTDARALCTQVSPPLAEIVGPGNADLVGADLLELAPRLDPTGRLESALRSQDTWSGVEVAWPIDDASAAVAVGLGAIPSFDPDRTFSGYRGYGVVRLDAIVTREPLRLAPSGSASTGKVIAFPSKALSTEDKRAFAALAAELRDQAGLNKADPVPSVDAAIKPSSLIEERVASTLDPAESVATNSEAPSLPEEQAALSLPAESGASVMTVPPSPQEQAASTLDPVNSIAAVIAAPSLPGEQVTSTLDPPESIATVTAATSSLPRGQAASTLDTAERIPAAAEAEPGKDEDTGEDPAVTDPAADTTALLAADPSALATADASRETEIARNGLALLDKLAVGLLVSRDNVPIFANRHLLDFTGFSDEDALHAAGGMAHLFGGTPGNASGAEAVAVRTRAGTTIPATVRLQRLDWDGLPATLLTLQGEPGGARPEAAELDVASKPTSIAGSWEEDERRELRAILETATDGVAVMDDECHVLSLNRAGEALFGCDRGEVVGKPFLDLFAAHDRDLARDYLEGVKSDATRSLLNDGREFLVTAAQGGPIPVFMTLGRLGPTRDAAAPAKPARYCALFRDLTHWKQVEGELGEARRTAERASALKSDFLAKVSHEVRTPLNAIIGFAEVMMEERFGPLGSERYREYLRDIHGSGTHVMSLVNDLLDLSKIEAGRMELAPRSIDINLIVSECVALMQPQASRERVIMRLSLAPNLPNITADERSLRQIALNLLSNAVKYNEPGGQVIVASQLTESGHVVLRIRDTGPGMSETDIAAALEPFRQLSRPTTSGVGGTGLGLPLTKALVEANDASLTIRSKVDQGTFVEVAFPPIRVLAAG